jgi:hypothetical protein
VSSPLGTPNVQQRQQPQANSLPRPSNAFGRSNVGTPSTLAGRSSQQEKNQFPRPSNAFGRSSADQLRQQQRQQEQERNILQGRLVPVRADAGLLDEEASRIEYGMTTEEERYKFDQARSDSNGVLSKWDLSYWMTNDSSIENKNKPTYRRNGERDTRFDTKPSTTPWINRDYSSTREYAQASMGVGTTNSRTLSSSMPSRWSSSWETVQNQPQDMTYNKNYKSNGNLENTAPSSSSNFPGSFDSSMEDFRNQGGTRSYMDSVSKSFTRIDSEQEIRRQQEEKKYWQNGNTQRSSAPPRSQSKELDSGFLSVAKQLWNGLRWDDEYMDSRRSTTNFSRNSNYNNNNNGGDRGGW